MVDDDASGKVQMLAAFVCWNDRLAPLFDTAVWWMLVDCREDGVVVRTMESLMDTSPDEKVKRALRLGVEVIVCGAISRSLEVVLEAQRITVHSFLAGSLDDLVEAFVGGHLQEPAFTMPGCGQCRRKRHGRSDLNQACDHKTFQPGWRRRS